jgi:hypothetical protein
MRTPLIKIAAERPKHQVGKHDRQADRHHRLPEILTFHAAEDGNLQQDTDQRHSDEGSNKAQDPGAGRGADGITDIAAKQIERAVRQVDIAHQPEDQREAARYKEIETAERDAVEDGVEKNLLPAERLL